MSMFFKIFLGSLFLKKKKKERKKHGIFYTPYNFLTVILFSRNNAWREDNR